MTINLSIIDERGALLTRADLNTWLDQVAADPRVPPTSFLLCWVMARAWERDGALCMADLARACGRHRRSIQRSTIALEHCGHVKIRRAPGASSPAICEPVMQRVSPALMAAE